MSRGLSELNLCFCHRTSVKISYIGHLTQSSLETYHYVDCGANSTAVQDSSRMPTSSSIGGTTKAKSTIWRRSRQLMLLSEVTARTGFHSDLNRYRRSRKVTVQWMDKDRLSGRNAGWSGGVWKQAALLYIAHATWLTTDNMKNALGNVPVCDPAWLAKRSWAPASATVQRLASAAVFLKVLLTLHCLGGIWRKDSEVGFRVYLLPWGNPKGWIFAVACFSVLLYLSSKDERAC